MPRCSSRRIRSRIALADIHLEETTLEAAGLALDPAIATEPRRWWVYLIVNEKGRSYVGVTFDISPARRLAEHNSAGPKAARSTRSQGPWVLIHAEPADDRGSALSREWHLKRDRVVRRRLAQDYRAAQS